MVFLKDFQFQQDLCYHKAVKGLENFIKAGTNWKAETTFSHPADLKNKTKQKLLNASKFTQNV